MAKSKKTPSDRKKKAPVYKGGDNADTDADEFVTWTKLSTLPIKKMILYQHGIGFIERRSVFTSSKPLQLMFDENEMNDILKSLCIFDAGLGKVTGVSFETGEDLSAALKQKAIQIAPENAVLGLFQAIRGYTTQVRLLDSTLLTGKVLGLENLVGSEFSAAIPAQTKGETANAETKRATVPDQKLILLDDDANLQHIPVKTIGALRLEDPYAQADLEYFLETSRSLRKQASKSMTVFLDGDQHDLTVGYLTTMPAWRISYRLLYFGDRGILQGWGIVENQLDEDLNNVDLTLISGMPISFVYDIYAPSGVKREYIREERAGMKIPVTFEQDARFTYESDIMEYAPLSEPIGYDRSEYAPPSEEEEEEEVYKLTAGSELTTMVDSEEVDLGERFVYHIANPISIRRGQSALVPLFNSEIAVNKEHIYNKSTTGKNPLVCMLIKNSLDMILDRGPITVFDEDLYAGEAILPFTTYNAENRIAYATDLSVECDEKIKRTEEFKVFTRNDRNLVKETYLIETYTYNVENKKDREITVIIEHPKSETHEIFDTQEMLEETESYQRWRFKAPPQKRSVFTIKQRLLVKPEESIINLTLKKLEEYNASGKMPEELYEFCKRIIELKSEINDNSKKSTQLDKQVSILRKEWRRLDQNLSTLMDPSTRKILKNKKLKKPLNGDDLVVYGVTEYLNPLERKIHDKYQTALIAHQKRISIREDCRDFLSKKNTYLDGQIRLMHEPSWSYAPSEPSEDLTDKTKELLKEDLPKLLIDPLTVDIAMGGA